MGMLNRIIARISAGPSASFAPSSPSHGASIVTSPPLPSGTTRRTDPRAWAYRHVALSSFEEAQPFDVDATVAGWITQIGRDRSGMALRRYATEHIGPTDVYLDMKDLGRKVRREAGTALNREQHYPQAFDPDGESNYSPASIIRTVCRLYDIDLIPMQAPHRLIAAKWGTLESPAYAYLQTFSTLRAPLLAYEQFPFGEDTGPYTDPTRDNNLWQRNTSMWAFHAACCLAKYLLDRELYGDRNGRGAVPEIVAPFNPQVHAAILPLTHAFAKKLLGIKEPCPAKWPCACNYLDDLLTQVPSSHPQQTGVLPTGAAWTPPPAAAGDFGGYASPSRTLTPPQGIRQRAIMHEYQRRQTDPNLRRASNGGASPDWQGGK